MTTSLTDLLARFRDYIGQVFIYHSPAMNMRGPVRLEDVRHDGRGYVATVRAIRDIPVGKNDLGIVGELKAGETALVTPNLLQHVNQLEDGY